MICLQEVENSVFDDLSEKLVNKNYRGEFSYGEKEHGQCTFYNSDVFELKSTKVVDLDRSFEALGVTTYKEDSKKHNVSQMMHLQVLDSDHHILLVNSHLHWNPNNDVVKYGQGAYLLSETHKEAQKIQNENSSSLSIIMVGDYNSRPESALVNMIKHHRPTNHTQLENELHIEAYSDPDKADHWLKQRRSQLPTY